MVSALVVLYSIYSFVSVRTMLRYSLIKYSLFKTDQKSKNIAGQKPDGPVIRIPKAKVEFAVRLRYIENLVMLTKRKQDEDGTAEHILSLELRG